MIIQRLKHLIRNQPLIFQLFWKRQETPIYKRRVIRPTDDLVIEGFPRSANTYATYALIELHETKLVIANHFHSPAQFILAKRYQVPSLLLIRKPIDAAISLSIYHQDNKLEKYLLAYIYFHKPLLKIQPSLLVKKFEDATSDINSIAENLNERFNFKFNLNIDLSLIHI